jgi:hypothetical protein
MTRRPGGRGAAARAGGPSGGWAAGAAGGGARGGGGGSRGAGPPPPKCDLACPEAHPGPRLRGACTSNRELPWSLYPEPDRPSPAGLLSMEMSQKTKGRWGSWSGSVTWPTSSAAAASRCARSTSGCTPVSKNFSCGAESPRWEVGRAPPGAEEAGPPRQANGVRWPGGGARAGCSALPPRPCLAPRRLQVAPRRCRAALRLRL